MRTGAACPSCLRGRLRLAPTSCTLRRRRTGRAWGTAASTPSWRYLDEGHRGGRLVPLGASPGHCRSCGGGWRQCPCLQELSPPSHLLLRCLEWSQMTGRGAGAACGWGFLPLTPFCSPLGCLHHHRPNPEAARPAADQPLLLHNVPGQLGQGTSSPQGRHYTTHTIKGFKQHH